MRTRSLIAWVAALVYFLPEFSAKAQFFDHTGWGRSGYYRQTYAPGYSSIARSAVTPPSGYGANTILISTSQRRLYYIDGNGQTLSYGIGVGRAGFAWSGLASRPSANGRPGRRPPKCGAASPACPATWRAASTIRSARALSISAPRSTASTLERAANHRPGGVVRVLPHDQRGRDRPVQSRAGRHQGRRDAVRAGPQRFAARLEQKRQSRGFNATLRFRGNGAFPSTQSLIVERQ